MDEDWKPLLQRNRTYLVKNIDFQESELWDAVQSVGIITGIQVQSLQGKHTSNFRQVGAFIDHLLKRDRSQYDKFLYALKETGQDHVVEFLEAGGAGIPTIPRANVPAYVGGMPGFLAPGYQPVRQEPMYYQRSQPQPSVHRSGPTPFDALPVEAPVIDNSPPQPASPVEIMALTRTLNSLQPDNIPQKSTLDWFQKQNRKECYPIKYKTRGRAIVITMTGNREGWKADVTNVAKMLNFLDFLVEYEYDLTHEEYMEKLNKFSNSDMNGHVDCVWVILMGHGGTTGGKDYILSKDGKALFIKDTFEKTFNNKICLALQRKPKAFIVQMCRGDKADAGVACKTQSDADRCVKLGTFTDYIFGYATQEGHKAFRHIDKGSWYIENLADVFMEKAAYTSVTDMLTEVNRRVGKKESDDKVGYVQTTEMSSTLSYKWFLVPGLDPSEIK